LAKTFIAGFGSFLRDENYLFSWKLRKHERTGRALGNEGFFSRIEGILKRVLRKQKSCRKKMVEQN